MPAVLITLFRPNVTHDSPFSLAVAGATASTHLGLPTEGWLMLNRPGCLVLSRGGLSVLKRSPIQALTGSGVE